MSVSTFVSDLPTFRASYFDGAGANPYATRNPSTSPTAATSPTAPTQASKPLISLGPKQNLTAEQCGPGEHWDDGKGRCVADDETDPGCPSGYHKVTGPEGSGCVPDGAESKCPDGYEWELGDPAKFPNGRCKIKGKTWDESQGTSVGGGSGKTGGDAGGGSGGGGGGGGFKFEPWTPPAQTPFEADFEAKLKEFMDNWDKTVPFTDSVISNLKTNAFKSTFGRVSANKAAIDADAAAKGTLRSTPTDRRIDNMIQAADSTFADSSRNIDTTAAQQNFQAQMTNRLAALDRAQQHIDAEREYLMTSEMNQFARQSKLADLALAYYNLAQQRWQIQQQLNAAKYQFDASLDWSKQQYAYNMAQGASA